MTKTYASLKMLLRALQRGEVKKNRLTAWVYPDKVVFCVADPPDYSPEPVLELGASDALAQLLDHAGIRNG